MKFDAEKHDNWKTKLTSNLTSLSTRVSSTSVRKLIGPQAPWAPMAIGAVVGSLLALTITPTGAGDFDHGATQVTSASDIVLNDTARALRDGAVASRTMTERNQLADAMIADSADLAEPVVDPTLPATSVSAAGMQKLKDFEGFSLRGYLLGDGKCTIGWGHAVPVAQRPDCLNWVITEEEARAKFASDVSRFEDAVNNFFTRDFNQNQFDAIVSFAYNVGQVWFRWDWPTDPDDDFFQWVLPLYIYPAQFREGLMRRRAAELELFNTPVS